MRKVILALMFATYALMAENADVLAFMNELKAEAKALDPKFKDFSAKDGEILWNTINANPKDGVKRSCATCHTADLTKTGTHDKSGKVIPALSRSVNKTAMSDVANIKKWLKRNFNDVYGREGTAIEKGNSIAYILSK